jgi:hypothetical protein
MATHCNEPLKCTAIAIILLLLFLIRIEKLLDAAQETY